VTDRQQCGLSDEACTSSFSLFAASAVYEFSGQHKYVAVFATIRVCRDRSLLQASLFGWTESLRLVSG